MCTVNQKLGGRMRSQYRENRKGGQAKKLSTSQNVCPQPLRGFIHFRRIQFQRDCTVARLQVVAVEANTGSIQGCRCVVASCVPSVKTSWMAAAVTGVVQPSS